MQQYNKALQEMKNFYHAVKENIKEHNPNRSQCPDHPQILLLTGGSGSGKTNSLFHLINQQPDNGIYLYAQDPYERKYLFLTKKREDVETKDFNDSKTFNEYSNDMDDIYKNIEEYSLYENLKY